MTRKTYYLFALMTPLGLPLVVYPLQWYQPLKDLVMFLLLSLIIGGIPYLALMVSVIAWANNQSGVRLQWATFFLPPLFAFLVPSFWLIVTTIYTLISSGIKELCNENFKDGLGLFQAFAICSLGLGYAYVLLWALGCMLLKRCGIICDDQPLFISLNL